VGVALVAVLAGGVLGALLPVPVHRLCVPYGDPPRATCDHCGQRLVWAGTSCRRCGHRLGPQWWATAAVAGIGAGVLALSLPDGPAALVVPASIVLALLGTGLGAIDLSCRRLPSNIVLPSIVVGAVALTVVSAGTGDWAALGRAALGALVLSAIHLGLYLIPGGNLGFGDVQLAVLLGLLLGYLGWPEVVWGALLPWLLNAPVVLVLLLAGRVGRRSRVPFGPSMLAGAVLAVALMAALSG
jgi:leader peptidase (prepilin peptidase)/N-methyltransferase